MFMDLEPARTIIDLQARSWSKKSEYGLLGTYASCLFALLIPFVLFTLLSISGKALGQVLRPTIDLWFLSRAPLFTERTKTRY